MKELKTLNVNGEQYKIVDAQAQEDIGDIDTALDSILAIQEDLIGGESA